MNNSGNKMAAHVLLQQKLRGQAGEMAQPLRALGALPEDPGSIPSPQMSAHNPL